MNKRERKLIGLTILATSLMGSAAIGVAGTFWSNLPETYGPFTCGSCLIQTPIADAPTAAFIASYDESINGGLFAKRATGDSFVICSSVACVIYTRTASGGFLGAAAVPITQHGGGDAGGGPVGVGGDGSGAGTGGSCSVCDRNDDDRWGNVGDVEPVVNP